MTVAALLIGATHQLTPTAADNVTNHFAVPGDGMIRDQFYSNATGLPTSSAPTTNAFLTSGLIPITAAMLANGFTVSVNGAAPNWLFNGARINFYTASTASGHFVSSVTSGITQSADARTLTCVAASIPGTATHFATNLKWAQGIPSLVYSTANVIPTGAETDLATKIMVNSGVTGACLVSPAASGTSESVSAAPVLARGEFIVCRQGYSTYIRKTWKTGKHMVRWDAYSPESHDYNNCYQLNSVIEIADTTPAPLTPGAWASNYSSTGANATTYAVWSDNHPAYKMNGAFRGGVHTIIATLATSATHGKTNVDRGSIWNYVPTGKHYMLGEIYNADKLFPVALNTGTNLIWAIDQGTLTSGTFQHVSGATHTADFTLTAGVQAYLYPGTRLLSNRTWFEGARLLGTDGAFVAKQRIKEFSYQIPNSASALDYIAANLGSSADLNYNDASIPMQIQLDLRWIEDAWSQTVYHQLTALQAHHCNFSWPYQWQKINAQAGQSLHFIIPGTLTCAAATLGIPGDHSNGSAVNFSQWQNITTNAKEYYHDTSVWAAGWFWSDGVQRPPWCEAFGVKDSGGNWLRKFCMARSRIVGWTATGVPGIAHFLSSQNKSYGVTRYEEDVAAGDVRMCVAGMGWMDPAFDTNADISFAFPLGGGQYEWNWWASGAVTSYVVPVPGGASGKQFRLACRSAGCTAVIDNVARTVTVTTTGQGQGFVMEAF